MIQVNDIFLAILKEKYTITAIHFSSTSLLLELVLTDNPIGSKLLLLEMHVYMHSPLWFCFINLLDLGDMDTPS